MNGVNKQVWSRPQYNVHMDVTASEWCWILINFYDYKRTLHRALCIFMWNNKIYICNLNIHFLSIFSLFSPWKYFFVLVVLRCQMHSLSTYGHWTWIMFILYTPVYWFLYTYEYFVTSYNELHIKIIYWS